MSDNKHDLCVKCSIHAPMKEYDRLREALDKARRMEVHACQQRDRLNETVLALREMHERSKAKDREAYQTLQDERDRLRERIEAHNRSCIDQEIRLEGSGDADSSH